VFQRKFFIFNLSQNPFVVKLPQLLSQFLYLSKKLDLPGIGSFTLDPNVVIPGDSDKDLQTIASGISFKNTIIREPDDALVQFIKEHTGKMKPLAAADLDFFLTTGKQLLNIGKAFYLEGIGVLMQNKEGKLDFTPGEYSKARLEEPETEKPEKKTAFEESQGREPRSNTIRQGLLLAGIIGGLIVIGWGGYSLYKKNTVAEPPAEHSQVPESVPAAAPDTTVKTDTTKTAVSTVNAGAAKKPDTTPPVSAPAESKTPIPASPVYSGPAVSVVGTGGNTYKFVILETVHKGRALRRYNQLLGFQLNIKMDQKDSSWFKLYFPISAAIRDTAHIRDSLADVYAAHVSIER
jgi:hypothetical protein